MPENEAQEQEALEQITLDQERGRVTARFERTLYPLDAIYGAAYVFIDRCYVLLDAPDDKYLSVELRGRQALVQEDLEALAGEFANELLTQTWRHKITERNRLTIETATVQALAGAAGPPPMDELDGGDDLDDLPEDELLDDDVFDDPLGIAVPWEEKYGEGAKAEDEPAGQGAEPVGEGLAPSGDEQAEPEEKDI